MESSQNLFKDLNSSNFTAVLQPILELLSTSNDQTASRQLLQALPENICERLFGSKEGKRYLTA
jgi:hypothetical protein